MRKYDIDGRYPCKANWVVLKKVGDKIIARNCLINENNDISRREADYLLMLDGWTNPFGVEGYSIDECEELYEKLDSMLLLREGRNCNFGFLHTHTMYIPKKKRTRSVFPKLYNIFLMLLCVPTFLSGIKLFFYGDICDLSDEFYLPGIVIGLIVGMILHELSHAMACLSYGGRLLEVGIMLDGLPGAYCMLDQSTVSRRNNKLKKVQINLAGVEMNLLLIGVCLKLCMYAQNTVFDELTGMLYSAAFQNLVLVLINLLFCHGLDGEHVLALLLGRGNAVEQAKINIYCLLTQKRRHEYFKYMGINSIATIGTSCLIMFFQLSVPILILSEVLSLLGGALNWIGSLIF